MFWIISREQCADRRDTTFHSDVDWPFAGIGFLLWIYRSVCENAFHETENLCFLPLKPGQFIFGFGYLYIRMPALVSHPFQAIGAFLTVKRDKPCLLTGHMENILPVFIGRIDLYSGAYDSFSHGKMPVPDSFDQCGGLLPGSVYFSSGGN